MIFCNIHELIYLKIEIKKFITLFRVHFSIFLSYLFIYALEEPKIKSKITINQG